MVLTILNDDELSAKLTQQAFNVLQDFSRENTANIIDNTSSAFSVYGSLDLGDGFSLFGRYDQSSSENALEEQWNIENEGWAAEINCQYPCSASWSDSNLSCVPKTRCIINNISC